MRRASPAGIRTACRWSWRWKSSSAFPAKTQIEEYGIDEFNERCRESVFRYLKEWNSLTERIAYWVDLEHPYITMNNTYIETVWWAIKQMWDKGLIYQGYRVTPHCPRCGTSLSSHEVALGYKEDTEDPSVYIKFKVAGKSIGKSARRINQSISWPGRPRPGRCRAIPLWP